MVKFVLWQINFTPAFPVTTLKRTQVCSSKTPHYMRSPIEAVQVGRVEVLYKQMTKEIVIESF
jgi:hypothetical protein